MKKFFDPIEIARLLAQSVTSELSVRQKKRLAALLARYRLNNREDLERIFRQDFDPVTGDSEIRERVWATLEERMHCTATPSRGLLRRSAAIAAAAAVLLAGGIFLIHPSEPDDSVVGIEPIIPRQTVLEYPSENRMVLSEASDLSELLQPEEIPETELEQAVFTVRVPMGSTHTLQLEDGTTVLLYPGSQLRFPAVFDSGHRRVSLQGEGYFRVSPDAHRPFRVEAGGTEIQVLGTRFNVRAYEQETTVQTALVSGVVEVNRTRLQPDQMAVYHREKQTMQIQSIEAALYEERANGMFVFENRTLEEIMDELGRWFDFEYTYTDETMKDKRFRFKLSRQEDFARLTGMMQLTGEVSFRMNGSLVEIHPGR
ncbi:MAG: FecR domain-containing protein [Rikenellaceae bacterium]|nr:FecR domain-containing protein [Rikenellaceae bacterium]